MGMYIIKERSLVKEKAFLEKKLEKCNSEELKTKIKKEIERIDNILNPKKVNEEDIKPLKMI